MSSLQGKMVLGNPSQEFNLVSDVTNNAYLWHLCLRVIKQWRNKTKPGNEPGVDYIMIDRMGTPIHVKVIANHAAHFLDVFQTNNVYEMYRFSAYKATLGGRPVKHDHMLFLNSNTVVTPAEKDDDIPLHQKFDLVPLAKLGDYADSEFCIDIFGVITNWTNLRRAASGFVGREVNIFDQEGNDVRVQLWDKQAFDFDTNNIPNRAVLILTSAAVKKYEYGGSMKLGLSSTGGSMIHIDLDIPEVEELKACEILVDVANAPRNNIVMDWRKGKHSGIQEIVTSFKPYSKDVGNNPNILPLFMLEETYVFRAHIVAFTEMYNYEACPTCNIKVDTVVTTKRCRKHGVVEKTKPSGFVKIDIFDGTKQQTVTLFDRQVRDITLFTIEELVQYRDAGVNVAEFFNELKERIYLFELKSKTYHGALSLSASKIELDEDDTPLTLPPIVVEDKVAVPTTLNTPGAPDPSADNGTNITNVEKRKSPMDGHAENQKQPKLLKPSSLK